MPSGKLFPGLQALNGQTRTLHLQKVRICQLLVVLTVVLGPQLGFGGRIYELFAMFQKADYKNMHRLSKATSVFALSWNFISSLW